MDTTTALSAADMFEVLRADIASAPKMSERDKELLTAASHDAEQIQRINRPVKPSSDASEKLLRDMVSSLTNACLAVRAEHLALGEGLAMRLWVTLVWRLASASPPEAIPQGERG